MRVPTHLEVKRARRNSFIASVASPVYFAFIFILGYAFEIHEYIISLSNQETAAAILLAVLILPTVSLLWLGLSPLANTVAQYDRFVKIRDYRRYVRKQIDMRIKEIGATGAIAKSIRKSMKEQSDLILVRALSR